METLAKSDIFFVVTTIAVVLVSVFLSIALYYLIRILRRFKSISEKIEEETYKASDSLEDLVDRITNSFVFRILFRRRGRKSW